MDQPGESATVATSATTLQQGVQSTFETHHHEIRRRAQLDTSTINSRTFERVASDGLDDPFEHPDQRFVVFSLSQSEFAPRPRDEAQPALCVYGAFGTVEEAHEHARLVTIKQPECSVFVDRTHRWIVAPATIAHLTDAPYLEAHASRLLDRVRAQREADQREFDENVANQRAGEVRRGGTPPSVQDEATEATEASERAAAQRPNDRVHAECKLPEQRCAAISFVCDDASPPEFLFYVYACHETDEAMHRYVCNTCGDRVYDHHIDVVRTCTWVFPQRMHGAKVAKEVYRSSELNKLMSAHKKSPQDVERFYREHPDVVATEAARSDERGNARDGAQEDWDMVGEASARAATD